jgi:hypothetical protein
MTERASTPAGSGDELSRDELDDDRLAELAREVVRAQERHREGGVEPELAPPDTAPEPEA